MVHMKTTSLVQAKAHLSELVDDAEHRGKRILILRHGKPAAALVPVDVATGTKPEPMTLDEARVFMGAITSRVNPEISAVDDLTAGRR